MEISYQSCAPPSKVLQVLVTVTTHVTSSSATSSLRHGTKFFPFVLLLNSLPSPY